MSFTDPLDSNNLFLKKNTEKRYFLSSYSMYHGHLSLQTTTDLYSVSFRLTEFGASDFPNMGMSQFLRVLLLLPLAVADWAETIDYAGRQRTLSQKMTKEFLLISRGSEVGVLKC